MEQLVQSLKDGKMELLEVPFPALGKGQILVRNHYSLISAGTEGKTVKDARLGYIGKALARKEEVKKVVQSARTLGILKTYRMVMNRLDAPSSLGYSCAGTVIAVADDVTNFKIGDTVACGGNSAVHAEVVAVPVKLCTYVDTSVPLDQAAFTTVGAIALQGVRQADLRLGENCVVIGLGLVGQITLQLLQASGVNAIGIDIEDGQVMLAQRCGFENSYNRNHTQLESVVMQLTGGHGCDAVIITASTSSNDPVNLAGVLCRRKGKVIVVGAVSTDFNRKNYYQKELDLRMSSSYGPGRYDSSYEEEGKDYPYPYVRWTLQRNMQAFAELLLKKSINLQPLLTHSFPFESAPDAYQLILERNEPFAGIVLKYNVQKEIKARVNLASSTAASSVIAGVIGAGSFGQNFLLPALKGKVEFKGVSTSRSNNARNVADKFGFAYCTGNADEIINDPTINTIFIATRHDSHAEYVLKALKAKKNVFTEKPLCLNRQQLEEIIQEYNHSGMKLMCGFNRRFAPMIANLKNQLSSAVPVAINYRINAGVLPANHWVHNPETGGGRIIGEACHFIDLCSYLSSSPVRKVSAFAMKDGNGNQDTAVMNLYMENGSVATVSYFSNGNKSEDKELIEIYNGGLIATLRDFTQLTIHTSSGRTIKGNQDKGHAAEMEAFTNSISRGLPTPIPENELFNVMEATFGVMDSIAMKGEAVEIHH